MGFAEAEVSTLAGPQPFPGPHRSVATSAASAKDTPHAAMTSSARTNTPIVCVRRLISDQRYHSERCGANARSAPRAETRGAARREPTDLPYRFSDGWRGDIIPPWPIMLPGLIIPVGPIIPIIWPTPVMTSLPIRRAICIIPDIVPRALSDCMYSRIAAGLSSVIPWLFIMAEHAATASVSDPDALGE